MTTVTEAPSWRRLTGSPLRFLASSWPWRSVAYLLTGWIVGIVWAAGALLLVVPAFGLVLLLGGVPLAAVERRRLRLVDPAPAHSPHSRPARPGVWAWLSTRFREPVTWRELGYAFSSRWCWPGWTPRWGCSCSAPSTSSASRY